MKHRYAIGAAFFISGLLGTTIIARAAGSDAPYSMNDCYNMKSPITVSPNQSYSNSTNINISVFQEMASSITNSIKNLYEAAHKAYEKGMESLSDLTVWAGNNKLKVAFFTAASLYGYITYRLFALKSHLMQPDNWSLWNNSRSLEELSAIPEKELGEILIKEAQRRYTLLDDPENFIMPIVIFLQTVEQEKQILQAYISLCGWIKTVRLGKIFWIDEQLATSCEERLKRLAYIRAIFVNWITEYKFTRNAAPAAA